MSTATTASPTQREPELLGQTVVVIGGSAGIGLETARRARAEGANVILTGRNPERLQRAASELGALSTAAFDATDPAALERFFRDLPTTIDHVMVTAGRPYYGRLARHGLRAGAPRPRRAPLAGAPGRPQRRRQGETGRHAAVHGRHRRPPPRRSASGSCRPSPPHSPPSRPAWRSSSRRSGSTSSPPASSTRRCRHRSSATSSKTAAISFAPRFPSGASSDRPTSPRSPYTS